MEQKKTEPDFLIKRKNAQTSKYETVGRAWKKTGQYGPFISVSMKNSDGGYDSYLMVANTMEKPRAAPPPPPPKKEPSPFEDL